MSNPSLQENYQKIPNVTFMSEEFKKLSEECYLGRYKELEKDLEDFIRNNKETIKKFKESELENLVDTMPTDELAIKLYIIKTRTINPSTEIKKELEEIEKEVWYQGEKLKSPADRNKIAIEWCRVHAPGWRDNWVMTALYVFEHNKEHYLKLFQE
jgi:hypothetical protein